MYKFSLFLLIALTLAGCSLFQKTADEGVVEVVTLDTIEVEDVSPRQPYKASATRVVDLIHTKLDVKFDWEKQYLYGKANLTFKPHFYDVESFKIDAKGFDVNEVSIVGSDQKNELPFEYDGLQITVQLPQKFTRKDTFEVFIEYTAKPNELELEGSSAITDAKGLYFINPLDEDPDKPMQIWTQGEPESNSAWFPTIDKPNEKISQELAITVEEKYKTLSNGVLEFSELNGDGTRTDHWVQKLEHPPYLVMMAVGEFSVTEDKWRDSLDLYYYVEEEYAPYAQLIFGDTPEMIEFFSTVLNYDYPWDKYAQIVVRDYVSGAMENTGAVIFGEFTQVTDREIIDQSPEDIIAHELAHHWFGNIVTCESWANLPLNESFASYAEYLWREHKHGRDNADMHLHDKLNNYLSEFKRGKIEDLIRFNYADPGDMFDRHSYDKGSRVLHMLRKYVGDDAFFASLNKYLKDNEYKAVEIHNLRLAFEEVTGEDLNWFFNQWFLDKSHPKLKVSYDYDDSLNVQYIHVEQTQDFEKSPVYKLPIDIDFYFLKGSKVRKTIVIDSVEQTFAFEFRQEPRLVNFDAEKMLLAEIKELKPVDRYLYQYHNTPLFEDRLQALEAVAKHARKNSKAAQTVIAAIDDPVSGIKEKAVSLTKRLPDSLRTQIAEALAKAATDKESAVRATALSRLPNFQEENEYEDLFIQGLKDSSYYVNVAALEALYETRPAAAMEKAADFENTSNSQLALTVAALYLADGKDDKNEFFLSLNQTVKGFERVSYLDMLSNYATQNVDYEFRSKAVEILNTEARKDVIWFIKLYGAQGLSQIRSTYDEELEAVQEQYDEGEEMSDVHKELVAELDAKLTELNEIIEVLKEEVDDARVRMVLE